MRTDRHRNTIGLLVWTRIKFFFFRFFQTWKFIFLLSDIEITCSCHEFGCSKCRHRRRTRRKKNQLDTIKIRWFDKFDQIVKFLGQNWTKKRCSCARWVWDATSDGGNHQQHRKIRSQIFENRRKECGWMSTLVDACAWMTKSLVCTMIG